MHSSLLKKQLSPRAINKINWAEKLSVTKLSYSPSFKKAQVLGAKRKESILSDRLRSDPQRSGQKGFLWNAQMDKIKKNHSQGKVKKKKKNRSDNTNTLYKKYSVKSANDHNHSQEETFQNFVFRATWPNRLRVNKWFIFELMSYIRRTKL